jgi:hypothetical protein
MSNKLKNPFKDFINIASIASRVAQTLKSAKKSTGPAKKSTGPAKKSAGLVKKSAGLVKKSAGLVKKSAGPVKKSAGPVVRGTFTITANTITAAVAVKADNMRGAMVMETNGLENINFSLWASEDSDTDTP